MNKISTLLLSVVLTSCSYAAPISPPEGTQYYQGTISKGEYTDNSLNGPKYQEGCFGLFTLMNRAFNDTKLVHCWIRNEKEHLVINRSFESKQLCVSIVGDGKSFVTCAMLEFEEVE